MNKNQKNILKVIIPLIITIIVIGLVYFTKDKQGSDEIKFDSYTLEDSKEDSLKSDKKDDTKKEDNLNKDKNQESKTNKSKENSELNLNSKIVVYISGEVKKPNVYTLETGDRVGNLVEMAGGFTEKADRENVNLAQILSDEEHISVSVVGEINPQALNNINTNKETKTPDNKSGKLNINTATAADLEELDGIGEKRAKQIVEYREENGNYSSIEDLKGIGARIGEKTFDSIKDKIEVK